MKPARTTMMVDALKGNATDPLELSSEAVLDQVNKITNSVHFRNSKRYPAFLQYVVEQALLKPGEVLKERTIGVEVFHRPSGYDTAADPIVRITAGEIRKRLAQYYQNPGHLDEIRIELPIGAYLPQFSQSAHVDHSGAGEDGSKHAASLIDANRVGITPERLITVLPGTGRKREAARAWGVRPLYIYSMAALIFLSAALYVVLHARVERQRELGLQYCWNPVLSSDSPILLVIGTHSLDGTGRDSAPGNTKDEASGKSSTMLTAMIRADMIPISDLVSTSSVIALLARNKHAFLIQAAQRTTFEQVQRGPVFLIGAFDNPWTLRITSKLPYFFDGGSKGVNRIIDKSNPSHQWSFDNTQSAVVNSRDYAIVASLFDSDIQQRVLIAAGIGKNGTAAATEFLTTNKYLTNWLAQTRATSANFEVLLATEIVGGQQGPPMVIGSRWW